MQVFGVNPASREFPEDTYVPPEDTYSPPGETWKDPSSGLTWQVAPTGGSMSWSDAKSHCQGLSPAGGWHLPTIGELRTLIRGCLATQAGGSCTISKDDCLAWSCWDDSCGGCSSEGGAGADGLYWTDDIEGDCCWYWSSSPVEDDDGVAWGIGFGDGGVDGDGVGSGGQVRCVR